MVTHTRNLCSAFNPSKCTHTAVSSEQTHTHTRTHTVNTPPEQWAAIYAAVPGEQLGFRCLAQRSHLSRGIEGGESAGHSLPPPTIPARPETWTRDLWVTSPTLYPLGRAEQYIACESRWWRFTANHGTGFTDEMRMIIAFDISPSPIIRPRLPLG